MQSMNTQNNCYRSYYTAVKRLYVKNWRRVSNEHIPIDITKDQG
jgi:hypothetical protein